MNTQSLQTFYGNHQWLGLGTYMLVLIVGTGIFLTLRLFFWQIRMLPLAFKQVFGKHDQAHSHTGDISHFRIPHDSTLCHHWYG